MKGKRIIDLLLFIVSAIVCAISFLYLSGYLRLLSSLVSGGFAAIFVVLAFRTEQKKAKELLLPPDVLETGITEITLLNEEDEIVAEWDIYGKISMVIGRDVGDNHVNINLNNAVFSSMIDIEHAVLNYSAGNWYVEDLGSKNGISVIKPDGKKYQLTSGKPCLLGKGDVLYIAMTRLLLR